MASARHVAIGVGVCERSRTEDPSAWTVELDVRPDVEKS